MKRCSNCNSLMPDDAPKCIKCGFATANPPAPSASPAPAARPAVAPLPSAAPGERPTKSQIHLSESLWRFLAVVMVFILSWMLWIFYQISQPPLILNAAFEAAAKAKAKQIGTPSAQRVITSATSADEPAKSAAVTPPPVGEEDHPKAAAAVPPPAVQAEPAPEKPVEEKPVAAKASDVEVIDTVEAWAKAWSSRDVDAYLAFYAKDFKTPGGEPRAEWEKGRRQRIAASKRITVAVNSFKVSFAADSLSTVTFRQSYSSDVINSDLMTKALVMAKVDGRWLIQQEKAGN